MLNRFIRRFLLPRVCGITCCKKSSVLLSLASVYLWDEQGISKTDMSQTVREFWRMYQGHEYINGRSNKMKDYDLKPSSEPPGHDGKRRNSFDDNYDVDDETNVDDDEWEAVILKDHLQVYRKLVHNSTHLYQYKIFGSYTDVPAKAFFLVQLDTKFRKLWDNLVVKLDVLDAEKFPVDPDYDSLIDQYYDSGINFDSKNQVIQWIMHYPYPMYCREYCYVRRAMIDLRSNLLILVSKSTDHPSCIKSSDNVRVSDYDSRLVIRPHKNLHENGFDYLLTYFDDPQSAFPSAAYNWMAYSGVPDFVHKLHDAAIRLNAEMMKKRDNERISSTDVPFKSDNSCDHNDHNDRLSSHDQKTDVRTDGKNETKSSPEPVVKAVPPAAKTSIRTSSGASSSGGMRVDSGHSLFQYWSAFFFR